MDKLTEALVGMAQTLLRASANSKPTEAQVMFAIDKVARLVDEHDNGTAKMAAHVELSRRYCLR